MEEEMQPASVHDRQVSFDEAETFLGYRRSAIYEMIKAGRLRPVKVGKFTRFYQSELRRYLDDNTRPYRGVAAE
jgi:excisionase family DNA binding protein